MIRCRIARILVNGGMRFASVAASNSPDGSGNLDLRMMRVRGRWRQGGILRRLRIAIAALSSATPWLPWAVYMNTPIPRAFDPQGPVRGATGWEWAPVRSGALVVSIVVVIALDLLCARSPRWCALGAFFIAVAGVIVVLSASCPGYDHEPAWGAWATLLLTSVVAGSHWPFTSNNRSQCTASQ